MDKNKGLIKLEEHELPKKLPNIKTNKDLKIKKAKRVAKDRDLSMTVIKSGRLALQDDKTPQELNKKNASVTRDVTKKPPICFPMNRKEACVALEEFLFEYEQLEILDYDKIYYFNVQDRKSKKIVQLEGDYNFGFDHQNGDYRYFMRDHVAYRYELIAELGKGSFGVVIKAFDHLNKEYVALKMLRNRKKLHTQGVVEAKLIEHLNNNDPDDK